MKTPTNLYTNETSVIAPCPIESVGRWVIFHRGRLRREDQCFRSDVLEFKWHSGARHYFGKELYVNMALARDTLICDQQKRVAVPRLARRAKAVHDSLVITQSSLLCRRYRQNLWPERMVRKTIYSSLDLISWLQAVK